MKKNKAQMEIMGLAVIVILIVLGFTFMVTFMVRDKPSDLKGDYDKKQLAENVVNTLLRTTATTLGDCAGMSFTDLLIKCKEIGPASAVPNCEGDGTPLCTYTTTQISLLLKDTVGTNNLNYEYYFKASSPLLTSTPFIEVPAGGECTGSQKAGLFTIPLGDGTNIHVELDICS